MKTIYTFFVLLATLVLISAHPAAGAGDLHAVNDTVDLYGGVPITVNLTLNDTIPAGDTVTFSIVVPFTCNCAITWQYTGLEYTFTSAFGCTGNCEARYIIRCTNCSGTDTSSAYIYFRNHGNGIDSLYLNNINATFACNGSHFFNKGPKFEVPKFSGKSTIFLNTFWIGGVAEDDSLYLAAQRYGQGPYTGSAATRFDFYAGPVMDASAYSTAQDTVWNRIWNLKRSEIEYHQLHWNDAGYQPIKDIRTWPGNGNTALGQAARLAPFFDRNNDGIYNPMDGDYPLIRGDQALYFIFNDDRSAHMETLGKKMKAEIHGMGYVFDIPSDTSFYNTVFLNYQIINRSQRTYSETYIGMFTDFDIGYATDDYLGCDVQRGCYYGYNGTPVDGTGQSWAYGANPPVQAVTILAGPYMDPDGLDNPKTDSLGHPLCNESVNGTGFGDGHIDNERYGMRKFLYTNNNISGVPYYMQDPNFDYQYYNTLRGIWRDSTQMIYGGNGHASAGGYGPACDFMFPALSDTLNWGVGCQPPNGPRNWTETTAGNNPSDRRGTASMGPFTFHPGDVQELDVAFTFSRQYDTTSSVTALDKLKSFVDQINHSFASNTLPNGQSFNGLNETGASYGQMLIYPNPSRDKVTLSFNRKVRDRVNIRIVDFKGMILASSDVYPSGGTTELNVSSLPAGFYLVVVSGSDFTATSKLAIVR